jgi:hypothetical protein
MLDEQSGYCLNLRYLSAFCRGVLWKTPLTGISIGFLGFGAAVMSLRGEMRSLEKAAWMIVIGLLLWSEYRAIGRDHRESEAAQRKQEDNFAEILRAERDNINRTLNGFQDETSSAQNILDTTRGVSKLAQENLLNMTGGIVGDG